MYKEVVVVNYVFPRGLVWILFVSPKFRSGSCLFPVHSFKKMPFGSCICDSEYAVSLDISLLCRSRWQCCLQSELVAFTISIYSWVCHFRCESLACVLVLGLYAPIKLSTLLSIISCVLVTVL